MGKRLLRPYKFALNLRLKPGFTNDLGASLKVWRYLWLAVDPLNEGVHDEGVVIEAEAHEPQEGQ